jgi:hypothetical protein
MPGPITAFDMQHAGQPKGPENVTDRAVVIPIVTDPTMPSVTQKNAERSGSLCLLPAAVTGVTDLFKVSPVTRAHGDKLKMGSDW